MNTFARTALLGLALATTGVVSEASAQSPLFQWLRLMPMNGGAQRLDTNRDGRVDAILYDVDGNGRIDAIRGDGDYDGWLETVLLDVNGDGVMDEFYFDLDRNGSLETAFGRSRANGNLDLVAFDRRGYGYFSNWMRMPPQTASNGSDNRAMNAAVYSIMSMNNPAAMAAFRSSQAAINRNMVP